MSTNDSTANQHYKQCKQQLVSISPFDSEKRQKQAYSNYQLQYPTSTQMSSSRRMPMTKNFDSSPLFEHSSLQSFSHLCLKHSQPYTNFCFSCKVASDPNKNQSCSTLLCSDCLTEHDSSLNDSSQKEFNFKEHDIRSIEKSSTFLKNSLKQSIIKLQAKCNILTNLNQQLNINKVDLYSDMTEYKQNLNRNFCHLKDILTLKQNQMFQSIDKVYIQHSSKLSSTIEEIKQNQDYYDRCHHTISEYIDSDNDFAVCHFYTEKHEYIQKELVNENELNKIKRDIYEVRWKVDQRQLEYIFQKIKELDVDHSIKYSYLTVKEKRQEQEVIQERIRQEQLIRDSVKKMIKVKSDNELLSTKYVTSKPSKKKLKKLSQKQTPDAAMQSHIHNHSNANYQNKYKLSDNKTPSFRVLDSRYQIQRNSHQIKQSNNNGNNTFCTSTPKGNASKQKRLQCLKKSPQTSALLKKRKKSFGKIGSMPASPSKNNQDKMVSSKDYHHYHHVSRVSPSKSNHYGCITAKCSRQKVSSSDANIQTLKRKTVTKKKK